MLSVCNGSAKMAEDLARRKRFKEQKLKATLKSSGRWSNNGMLDVSETSSASMLSEIPSTPRKNKSSKQSLLLDDDFVFGRSDSSGNNSLRQTSDCWNEEIFAKISVSEARKASALKNVEAMLKEQTAILKDVPESMAFARKVIKARIESENTMSIVLSLNEYRRLEDAKATTERVVQKLTNLLAEISCSPGTKTIADESKAKVQQILEEDPIKTLKLPVSGADESEIVEQIKRIEELHPL